jgi:hypothetical protein
MHDAYLRPMSSGVAKSLEVYMTNCCAFCNGVDHLNVRVFDMIYPLFRVV